MARLLFIQQTQPEVTVIAFWHDYDTVQIEWTLDRPYYTTYHIYKINNSLQTGVYVGNTTGLTYLVLQSAAYDYLRPNEGDQYYIEYYDADGWHRSNITPPLEKRPHYPFIVVLPIIYDV